MGLVEVAEVEALLCAGNVTPAFARATTGAEAGVNLLRSLSCHATYMGFPNKVVDGFAEPGVVTVTGPVEA